GRPLVAVDGSRGDYGGLFPYNICVIQALARASTEVDPDRLTDSQVYCPLDANLYAEVSEWAAKNRLEDGEAYRRLMGEKMAHMEIKLALKSLQTFRPFMIMLDGGFLLFDSFPEWDQLVNEACVLGCVVVGVIEEVATSELCSLTGLESPGLRIYDREFLFGLLEVGEMVVVSGESAIKRNYSTVFTRMGSTPQAVACDFLAEQGEYLPPAMNLIYTLTPPQGRGIPAWLDLVDREVRVTRKSMESLIMNGLDPSVRERFLRSNRERRGL
ncbi:MAG: DNA double-strand break repair nuclease NurA, partial [Bacillota bacterium]